MVRKSGGQNGDDFDDLSFEIVVHGIAGKKLSPFSFLVRLTDNN